MLFLIFGFLLDICWAEGISISHSFDSIWLCCVFMFNASFLWSGVSSLFYCIAFFYILIRTHAGDTDTNWNKSPKILRCVRWWCSFCLSFFSRLHRSSFVNFSLWDRFIRTTRAFIDRIVFHSSFFFTLHQIHFSCAIVTRRFIRLINYKFMNTRNSCLGRECMNECEVHAPASRKCNSISFSNQINLLIVHVVSHCVSLECAHHLWSNHT